MPDEHVLREGSSENLTAKATGGHVAEHYVVTTKYVNLQSGTLRTEAHQVRLEDIADVDLKQSMTQRAIGKGDVILTVERPGGGRETQKLSSVAEPKKVRDLIGTAIREAGNAIWRRRITLSKVPPRSHRQLIRHRETLLQRWRSWASFTMPVS